MEWVERSDSPSKQLHPLEPYNPTMLYPLST